MSSRTLRARSALANAVAPSPRHPFPMLTSMRGSLHAHPNRCPSPHRSQPALQAWTHRIRSAAASQARIYQSTNTASMTTQSTAATSPPPSLQILRRPGKPPPHTTVCSPMPNLNQPEMPLLPERPIHRVSLLNNHGLCRQTSQRHADTPWRTSPARWHLPPSTPRRPSRAHARCTP
jgi:hypothetical protein